MILRRPSLGQIGALCALLYVILSVGAEVYLGTQSQPATISKLTNEQNYAIILRWVHPNAGLLAGSSAVETVGNLLLIVVAVALLVILTGRQSRLGLIACAFGVVGCAGFAVAMVLQVADSISAADQLAHAGASAVNGIIKAFEDAVTRDAAIGYFANMAIAAWMGLIGAAVILQRGRRSVAGWASVAACLLQGLGLPVLIAWAAAACWALWRMDAVAIQPVFGNGWSETQAQTEPAARRTERSEPIEQRDSLVVSAQTEASRDLVMPSLRPPRGTAEPRNLPRPAKGSKASRPRKRS
jgi:hypothetical protein